MKSLVVFCAFIFFLLDCYAQTGNFRFDNLTEKQGLADANIASIVKDHAGYMWFASSEGLNRFDGKACRVYHHLNADTGSLSSDNINAVFEDSKQRLWVATRNGLNLYDPLNDNFKQFHNNPSNKNSISNNEVWSLAEDNTGGFWIGTMGGGLNKLIETKNNKSSAVVYSFIHFRHDSSLSTSLSDDIVWSIAFDKHGDGWLGTNNGLNRFFVKDVMNGKINFTHYFNNSSDKNSIATNTIWRVKTDNDNNLIWLLSFSGMLDCIDLNNQPQATSFIHVLPVMANALRIKDINPLTIIHEKANSFWIGTDKNGLINCRMTIQPNTGKTDIEFIEHFNHDTKDERSLVSDAVYELYKDESGIIWIGTQNGISRYTPQKKLFEVWHLNEGAPVNFPVKLIYTDNAYTWFAYNNRLWLLTDPQSKMELICNLDRSTEITSLYRTSAGHLFIGTSGDKLFFISRNNIQHFLSEKTQPAKPFSIHTGSIFSFLEKDSTHIITGGYSGLGLLNIDSLRYRTFFFHDQPGTAPIFRCLAATKEFYFAGTDNGLYTISKKDHAVRPWQPSSGRLSADRINSLLISDNKLWIATMNGLNVFDLNTNSVSNYFMHDGLPDNNITSLCTDAEGDTWIATRKGLSCYDIKNKTLSMFSENEGLYSNQLNTLAFNNNILFIGSDKGINTALPSSLKHLGTKINIAITDFKIAGRSQFAYPVTAAGKNVKQQRTVPVSWRENNISIEFTALEYKNPDGIQYAYMLEGFDKSWVYSGNRPQVSYTNLSGGNYIFSVKYAGTDGIWRQSNISIPVHVSTAWFKAWWFYFLLSGLTGVVLYSFYSIRINRIIEMQKVRNKIARDLHDDIGSTLSTIKILSDSAAKKIYSESANAEQMIKKIGDSSRKMMESMSDIVWSINPGNDSVNNIAIRMREYAAQTLEPKDISYYVAAEDKVTDIKLPLEKRRDFFLVFKEAINNLAKYSGASKAEISITCKGNFLELIIQDNGRGFDILSLHTGNGLKNMLQRAKNMQGNLNINSAPGKGTMVLLSVPLT